MPTTNETVEHVIPPGAYDYKTYGNECGTRAQLPLEGGYAATCHTFQGATIEETIYTNIMKYFGQHMLYSTCVRLRRLSDLKSFGEKPNWDRVVQVNPRAIAFMRCVSKMKDNRTPTFEEYINEFHKYVDEINAFTTKGKPKRKL